MRKFNLLWLLLLFVPLISSDLTLLKTVRSAVRDSQPFRVDFVQQVFLEDELEIEESGHILYQDQTRLLWTYTHPEHKVFLLEGTTYSFYEKESNQLIVGQIKEKNQQWIWQLLFSEKVLDDVRCDGDGKTIYIRNDNDDLDFEVSVGPGGLPLRVKQRDASGAVHIYEFRNYTRRVKLDPRAFELDLPDDVEVLDGHRP